MIGLGLASSHAPAMFRGEEKWGPIYNNRPKNVPQPAKALLETSEVIQGYINKIDSAFGVLRQQLEDYKPDALIMVGDDQGDLYNHSNFPAIAMFTGEEIWGARSIAYLNEPLEESIIHVPCHSELSNYLLKELMKKGFDIAYMKKIQALGRPERGVGHMVTYPAPLLMPKLEIPIIPIFLNCYFPPMPSAQRCWDLGIALAELLADRPERIAIYASGGLSHDPTGPRAGWIDEPLDHWILQRLETGKSKELTNLFTFDSDTLRGGTGEVRAWITAAGAMNRAAKIVDYIPAHHAKTGLGFAYWPTQHNGFTQN